MKNISILYEDENLVAVDKPAGLLVHPESGDTQEETLTDWITKEYPQLAGVGEPLRLRDGIVIDRPGIVHRLDKETSGVLVIAKTNESFTTLKTAFQEGGVTKEYALFCYGVPKERSGTIDRAIGRSAKDFRLRSAQRGARGKLREAVTDYAVQAVSSDNSAAYVKAMPRTGRTHQIRVHFKAIHHPVVCDGRYAPNQPCLFGFGRLALHARKLSLPAPTGEQFSIEAPLPADFQNALHAAGIEEEKIEKEKGAC